MAELNRQVLINLHSGANELSDATSILHGEIAIKHDNVTAATIYTRTTDDKVAKFITDLAVDAKVKTVNDALEAHKTAYNLKMTALENADTANANAISTETSERKAEDGKLDTRLTNVENLLGSGSSVDGSILERLTNVETIADNNAQAISAETEARTAKDEEHDTELSNHDTRITAAQAQADKGVEDAATAQAKADQVATDLTTTAADIRQKFADADAKLLGASGDAVSAETIWGAKNAAAAAQSAADAAQSDATYAKNKIDAFQAAAEVGDAAIDTLKEIQTWIASDESSTTEMLQSIADNKAAAAAAQEYAEGVAADLAEEITRATSAETANANAITAETQARESGDTKLLGASGDAVSAETIWGAKNAAAAAQTKAEQGVADAATAKAAADAAQSDATQALADAAGALSHSQGVATDLTTTAAAIRKEFADGGAKLLGASGDAVSAETIWGAKNAATANKNALDTLSGVVVKSGEITGVGAGNTGTITGSVSGNKLTFDFSNLVIDCGTF